MHDKVRIYDTRLLHLVGDDATDEVGLGGSEGGHQIVQLFPIGRRDRGEATALLAASTFAATATSIARLTGMIGEYLHQQFVPGFLELVDHRVVQRILVLLQPTRDIVRYLCAT